MTAPKQDLKTGEVVVAVPCFNEARRLPSQEYSSFLSRSPNVTIVLVDDGSTDDTPLIIERLRQQHPRQVCTLRLSSNVGKAEAVRRGMRVALRRQPAAAGYWDADLATPLDAIHQFVDVLKERQDVNLVMGSRVALLGRDIRRSMLRHFMGRAFATAASVVLRLPVYDTQCGAKLFRVTPAFRELISTPFRARWIFDVEILARIVSATQLTDSNDAPPKIFEYPLDQWRDIDGSRLKVLDFFVAAIDLAGIYLRHRRGAKHRVGSLTRNTDLESDRVQQRAA
jgi:glycosyltransferase involved in cell wall biosynthesis